MSAVPRGCRDHFTPRPFHGSRAALKPYPTVTRMKFGFRLAIFAWLIFLGVVAAQSEIRVGEDVHVIFSDHWRDGRVLSINEKDNRQFFAEFMFGQTQLTGWFNREQIRKRCEADAMGHARIWKSASGEFETEATLKCVVGDKVTLTKLDMSLVTISLTELSADDRRYVEIINARLNNKVARGVAAAAVPTLPSIEHLGNGESYFPDLVRNHSEVKPLGRLPDPLTRFATGAFKFNVFRDRQKVVSVIPVGGASQIVLVSAREENFLVRPPKFQSQLYWVSFEDRQVVANVAVTPEDFVLDYDPRYRLLLTCNRRDDRQKADANDYYTLWSLPINGSTADPLICWYAPLPRWPEPFFAKIINDKLVLAKTNAHCYEVWNVADRRPEYSLKSCSFRDAPLVLTADRRHLILPEDRGVAVRDALTGNLLHFFPVTDRYVLSANSNSDGSKLAALTERRVLVWDLTRNTIEPKVFAAPLLGSEFRSRIEWVDEDHVLLQGNSERILYRLSLQMPIWSYRLAGSDPGMIRDPLSNCVVDGHLIYVADPDDFDPAVSVGALKIPQPELNEHLPDLNLDAFAVLRPGSRIGLEIGKVSSRRQVEQWLNQKIKDNGWVRDDFSPIKLRAGTITSQPYTVQYQEFGTKSEIMTRSIRPRTAQLVIENDATVFWRSGTPDGPPPILRGADIPGQITRFEQDQLEFFRDAVIDPVIIDPKYAHGFGVSLLGLDQIEVVSTKPPGRPSDPLQAEVDSMEAQKIAREQIRLKALENPQ